jgi:uncharacterized protein (DUF362 family)
MRRGKPLEHANPPFINRKIGIAMNNPIKYQVRAVHCDHRASDEEVYQELKRTTDPLDRSWQRLKAAKRIFIKFNQDFPKPPPMFEGMRRELVSDQVARATLRLLRENTSAELVAADVSFFVAYDGCEPGTTTWLDPVFKEFDIRYLAANNLPTVVTPVPGGGLMFDHYFMPEIYQEADEWVSVQKMKNHAFMGITLSLKNLFGIMSTEPKGRPRHYYHHLVRMPYMLADIGRIFNPALNIIDALTGQGGQEWGYGAEKPFITDTLLAGDHPIATDACGASLMGHDPLSDWLTPPFHRDRNALLVAAQNGWGEVDLAKIDYQSEVSGPLGEFFAHITDSQQRVISWRRTTAEQGLYYRDHMRELVGKYAGEYILLQQGEVRWHDPSGRFGASRRKLAGDRPDEAMFLKYVDPDEVEGEHFDVYERTLQEIRSMAPSV